MSNTLDKKGDQLILTQKDAFENVDSVNDYTEDITGDVANVQLTKEFRYSIDQVEYSDWIGLSQSNLQGINSTLSTPISTLFVDFRYTVDSITVGSSVTINSVTLDLTFVNNTNQETQYELSKCNCFDSYGIGCDDDNNLFDPYSLIKNFNDYYDDLSKMTNKLFGHCVEYYKYTPKKESTDHVLHEHGLYEYKDKKEVNILIPENKFPDNDNIQYNIMGIEFPDFQAHIVKSSFEEVFGEGEVPQMYDMIYFSNLNILYEVQSVNENNNPYWRRVYYKVNLRKAEDRSSKIEPSSVEQEIDDMTLSSEDVTGEQLSEEKEDKRKPDLYRVIGTDEQDPVRKDLHKEIKIIEEIINNNWTEVSHSHYDLRSIDKRIKALGYKSNLNLAATDNRFFSSWFKAKEQNSPTWNVNVTDLGNNEYELNITTSDFNSDYMEIGDWIIVGNKAALITDISSDFTTVNVKSDKSLTTGSTTMIPKDNLTLLTSYSNYSKSGDGINFSLLNNHILININEDVYSFKLPSNIDNSKWHSIIIKLSNTYNQVSVFLYKLDIEAPEQPTNQGNNLNLIYNDTINVTDSISSTPQEQEWKLLGGNLLLTNIRWMDKLILEEDQQTFLNQEIITDTSKAIIVDNARKPLYLPYYPNNR